MFRNKIFRSEGEDKILKEGLTLYYFVKTVFSKKNYTKNLDEKKGEMRESCYKKICYIEWYLYICNSHTLLCTTLYSK